MGEKPVHQQYFSWISNNYLGFACILFANFCWVGAFIYNNQHKFHFVESALTRYTMQAIFSYCICRYFGYSITFKSRHDIIYLGIRSFIFVVHSFILGWTQFYLPLYAVHTISGFGPIFVCILNYFLNGVKINSKQLSGILVAFCGIVLTVNGRKIWGLIDPSFQFQTQFKNYKSDDPTVLLMVAVVFFINMMFWAYAILLTKKNDSHIVAVVYHQAIMGLIVSGISYTMLEVRVPREIYYPSILYSGCIIGGGFIIFNVGMYICSNTSVASLLTQGTVLVAYSFSIFRYGQPPNIVCILGACLLIGGVVMVIMLKSTKIRHGRQMSLSAKTSVMFSDIRGASQIKGVGSFESPQKQKIYNSSAQQLKNNKELKS